MQISQIRMESTPAKIDISTTPGQQTIEQPKAIVRMEQPKAEMSIQQVKGQLTIDQTAAWESMDIKHIFRRIAENAQNGRSDAMSGVARTASEGDELMRIEHGGSAIANQAKRNSELLNYDYNIGFVPPPLSVKINYHPGQVRIHVQPRQVVNDTMVQKPIIGYRPGQVYTTMKQLADLRIDFVDIEV